MSQMFSKPGSLYHQKGGRMRMRAKRERGCVSVGGLMWSSLALVSDPWWLSALMPKQRIQLVQKGHAQTVILTQTIAKCLTVQANVAWSNHFSYIQRIIIIRAANFSLVMGSPILFWELFFPTVHFSDHVMKYIALQVTQLTFRPLIQVLSSRMFVVSETGHHFAASWWRGNPLDCFANLIGTRRCFPDSLRGKPRLI